MKAGVKSSPTRTPTAAEHRYYYITGVGASFLPPTARECKYFFKK